MTYSCFIFFVYNNKIILCYYYLILLLYYYLNYKRFAAVQLAEFLDTKIEDWDEYLKEKARTTIGQFAGLADNKADVGDGICDEESLLGIDPARKSRGGLHGEMQRVAIYN